MGMITIAAGTNSTEMMLVDAWLGYAAPNPASSAPMNSDPESPMKIEAGLKLYGRKPARDPLSARHTAANAGVPSSANVTPRNKDAIAATPTATPSMLSSRFSALVTPMNQKMVTRTLTRCHGVSGYNTPALTMIAAAAPSAISLVDGRSLSLSSANPIANMSDAAAMIPKTPLFEIHSACVPSTNRR